MISFIKKLWNDRSGNILVIAAFSMPIVIGAAGLATDTIQWVLWKRELQRAADSAAMSGVYTSLVTKTEAAVDAAVAHDLTINYNSSATRIYADSELVPDSGVMTNQVRVVLQVQKKLPFTAYFMSTPPVIEASATAASVPDGAIYCVYAKDRSAAKTGITISGSSKINLGGCSFMSNSSHATAAASNGTAAGSNGGSGSEVTAASIAAQGAINYSSQWSVSSYKPYSSPIDDPFAAKVSSIPTSLAGCTESGVSIGGNADIDRSLQDTAGEIICMTGDQLVKKNVVLGAATYVINAGTLGDTGNNGSLTCDGCTIILTDFSNPAATKSVNWQTGDLNIKPPRTETVTSGGTTTSTAFGDQTWAGIAIYQDPRAYSTANDPQNTINGNTDLSIQGAIYFGNQSVKFNGGGSAESPVAACLQIIGSRIEFGGNSTIRSTDQCGNFGMRSITGSRRIRLVS